MLGKNMNYNKQSLRLLEPKYRILKIISYEILNKIFNIESINLVPGVNHKVFKYLVENIKWFF